jgi:hypothetical protein
MPQPEAFSLLIGSGFKCCEFLQMLCANPPDLHRLARLSCHQFDAVYWKTITLIEEIIQIRLPCLQKGFVNSACC